MKCMVCGNKVKNTDNMCTNCGSNLKSQREAVFSSNEVITVSNNNNQNNGAGKAIIIFIILFFVLPFVVPFIAIFMEIGDFFSELEEEIPNISTNCEVEITGPYGNWISDNNNYFTINSDQTLYYYDYYYDLSNNLTFGSSYIHGYDETVNLLGGEDKLRTIIFNDMNLSAFNYKDVYYIQFYPNRMFKDGSDILAENRPTNGYYNLLFVYDYDNGINYATIYDITNDIIYKVKRNGI